MASPKIGRGKIQTQLAWRVTWIFDRYRVNWYFKGWERADRWARWVRQGPHGQRVMIGDIEVSIEVPLL